MEKLVLNGFYFGFEGTGTATFVCTNEENLTDEILDMVTENEYDVANGTWAFEELKHQLLLNATRVIVTNHFITATPVLSIMGLRSHVEIQGVDVPFNIKMTPKDFDSRVRTLYHERNMEHDMKLVEFAS